MIQTLSLASMATPETWPRIQPCGNGSGQDGSTRNCGAAMAAAAANQKPIDSQHNRMTLLLAVRRTGVTGSQCRAG
jgi:hypothetical protein